MITVFLIQFLYVYLLGWQSRNVRDGQYLAAAITSTCIGGCSLFLTSIIARSAIAGADVSIIISFILAGPCAICFAMWSHDKWNQLK